MLHHETRGLCAEAADLAEAVCLRQSEGRAIDAAFVQRWGLSEPQSYSGLVPRLWRLAPDPAARVVEFHARLAVARRRWSAWSTGDQGRVSTYLLLSALVRSVNQVQPLLWGIERERGWKRSETVAMPLAHAFLEDAEGEDPEVLDAAYWSL